MTDIGNDILYGVHLERLFEWVETCLGRRQKVEAQTSVSELPLGSVARLGIVRFWLFRTLVVGLLCLGKIG